MPAGPLTTQLLQVIMIIDADRIGQNRLQTPLGRKRGRKNNIFWFRIDSNKELHRKCAGSWFPEAGRNTVLNESWKESLTRFEKNKWYRLPPSTPISGQNLVLANVMQLCFSQLIIADDFFS